MSSSRCGRQPIDHRTLSAHDAGSHQLTSVNSPLPLPSEHTTPQGIKVKVTPLDKITQQYREKREYASDDEESRYEIVLRYNRVA
jgi:hypothetical protein